jgi:hypothetical protein
MTARMRCSESIAQNSTDGKGVRRRFVNQPIRLRYLESGLLCPATAARLREKVSRPEVRTHASAIETHRLIADGLASCGFQQ